MVKQLLEVKQSKGKDVLERARQSLKSALSEVPFLNVLETNQEAPIGDKQADMVMDVLVSGKRQALMVEVKNQGEPRLVRMAIAQLKECLKGTRDSYGILIAPYLSDASRQICKDAGIGCMDLAGNAFLSFKNIFIDRSGIPNPLPGSRESKSVFSPKSSRILRVLLSDLSKKWYVEDLSQEANISIGLTSRVKQALLAQEWIKEENKRFYLTKPEEVLNQWASNYSYQKNPIHSFYSNLAEDKLEAAIRKECEKRKYRYGLALFSGASKVAPFVRFMKFFAYVDGNIEDIAAPLQLKVVESGANVILLQPYDEGVFYGLQNVNGNNVVSNIQLYLDLKSYKGRGEDAAQVIFEKRIKPEW